MQTCYACGRAPYPINSVTAFRARHAAAEAYSKAADKRHKAQKDASLLPGDRTVTHGVSNLPGDHKVAKRLPLHIFGSMREAFAIAA